MKIPKRIWKKCPDLKGTLAILYTAILFLSIATMVPATHADPGDSLVLWNKLGSNEEVLNSAFGPNLEFYQGGGSSPDGIANREYVPGVFANGVTIGTGNYYNMQRIRNIVLTDLPNYISPEQGTIEVWYKQKEVPIACSHGIYRLFDGAYGLESGVCFDVHPTCLRLGLGFGGQFRQITYDVNNLPNDQWIHLASVWDRSGIDGTTETIRLYADGNKVASGTYNDWGTSVGYWADICGGNDHNIAQKFAMDNLIIWNYAKTDFSDRFTESPLILATIDIDPDTLNLKSNGEWITTYIELPGSYDVNEIVVSTVKLIPPSGDEVVVDSSAPTTVGDYDSNGIPDLMVKFDRATVIEYLGTVDTVGDGTGIDEDVELTITGELTGGTPFEGSDTIRVIKKGK